MEAILGLPLPLTVLPKWVKVTFVYVKRVKAKTGVTSHLFSLGAFTKITVNFVVHFCVTPFGVAVRGKASLKIACIGHSVLGEPQCTILYCF